MGLEEGLLETNNQKEVMVEILQYVLDLKLPDPIPQVEKQHRSHRPRRDPIPYVCYDGTTGKTS